MKQWISDRLKERSTWIGLLFVFSALGMTLSPELKEAIIAAGMALGGVIAAATKDK